MRSTDGLVKFGTLMWPEPRRILACLDSVAYIKPQDSWPYAHELSPVAKWDFDMAKWWIHPVSWWDSEIFTIGAYSGTPVVLVPANMPVDIYLVEQVDSISLCEARRGLSNTIQTTTYLREGMNATG